MNWRLVAIPASMIPMVIIIVQFDIKLEDVLAIGAIPFAVAVAAVIGKLLMQGLKFSYIVKTYVGPIEPVGRLVGVKMGSEFVRFTTPMFVGGEVVIIYWLTKKGVSTSKASWIAVLEIVTEVLASGTLAMIAGAVALSHGAIVIGILILGVSGSVTGIWLILFFLSSKRTFQVPGAISNLVEKFGKRRRAVQFIDKTNQWMSEICSLSRENLRSKQAKKVLAVTLSMSFATWFFFGLSFYLIANGSGYIIDIFDGILAAMASNAIGNLPITVGGAGLTEIGLVAYLYNLDPFNLTLPEGDLEWNLVIAWRIAHYYVPIAITWFLLVRLALTKYSKANI